MRDPSVASGTVGEWQPPSPGTFAGIVPRALALVADGAVLVTYWAAVRFLPEAVAGTIGLVLAIAGPIVYFPLAWGGFGTTIGMRLLGLRIVRARDGTNIDARVAVVRFLVFLPSVVLALVIVGLLLALPVILDPRRRAMHDRVAGTVVVRVPFRGSRDLITFWWR